MPSSTSTSAEVVRQFFSAFGKGNLDGIVATFHPDVQIVSVRKTRKGDELYGSYAGKEGAKTFVTTLGKTLDTQAFAVDVVVGEGNVAFASGTFTAKVKASGKTFSSDWALKCVIRDGKIVEYHFFEDSAAFVEASL